MHGWRPLNLSDAQEEFLTNAPAEGDNGCPRLWLALGIHTPSEERDPDVVPWCPPPEVALMTRWGWSATAYFPDCEVPPLGEGLTEEQVISVEHEMVTIEVTLADDTAISFRVAPCLERSVLAMFAKARFQGVVLAVVVGFRDWDKQVELRSSNGCPDVHESSSMTCDVPTARPGESLHNVGLAIDFGCSERHLPCFQWLDVNAVLYGLSNFPVEPWHWDARVRDV